MNLGAASRVEWYERVKEAMILTVHSADEAFRQFRNRCGFVCVNRDYPDSTSPEQQLALFDALKSVPDIIAYIQDFNEDEYTQDAGKSLAVLS